MAKSILYTKIGKKQQYNLKDPEAVLRALKAVNVRIKDIASTWSTDSQIYRDYVATLVNEGTSQYVRLNKEGIIQFKQSKPSRQEINTGSIRLDALTKMLSKATKGDIINRVYEQTGRSRKAPSIVEEDRGDFLSYEEAIELAPELHNIESIVYNKLHEYYKLDKDKRNYKQTRWYKIMRVSGGKPDKQTLQKALDYMTKREGQFS